MERNTQVKNETMEIQIVEMDDQILAKYKQCIFEKMETLIILTIVRNAPMDYLQIISIKVLA